ncbi:DUF4007 family protein [Bacillus cereus]|uniref:DUF4007 family protein n=1 Tax=Bacillus cereus TaxID=1396 RepID=UPI000C28DFB5|nr:DUF4007 family protein [Bacillus cereus]MDZ4554949.1 DUF4007 family protein [Bacillus cereus]
MAYARHQSFYIRDKWVSKGLRAVLEDGRFFYDPEGFEKIGLGKNMVQSLRFWLNAMNLIEEAIIDGEKIHQLTNLGHIIYRSDRLLRKKETVSILHYQLVRNKGDLSTVFDWYFNIYKENVSQRESLLKSFSAFVKVYEGKEISINSLKKDIDCLVQLYTKKANEMDPEDIIFSPFTKIDVVTEELSEDGMENIRKVIPEINDIGIVALYYVLLSYSIENDVEMVSVEEIINEKNLWGKVFNLSRNKVIEALNVLTNHDLYPVEYVRTNNLDTVRIPKVDCMEYLENELNLNIEQVLITNGI